MCSKVTAKLPQLPAIGEAMIKESSGCDFGDSWRAVAQSPYHWLHFLESTGQQALVTFLKRCLAHPVTRVGPSAGGIELTLPQEDGSHLCFLPSQDFKADSHPCFFQENKDLSCFACKPKRGQNFRLPSHKSLIKSCGIAFTFVTFLDWKTSKRRPKSL